MENEQKKKRFKEILPVIYLVVGLLALRWTVVEPYVVPTGSMEPTLKTGDRLYALKCAYDVRFPFTDFSLLKISDVKRGDVILFKAPRDPGITYVKRAIGLPGDRIEFRAGALWVNGKEMVKGPAPEAMSRDVMSDIPRHSEKTLYLEDLTGVKHYVILDNYIPQARDMEEIVVPPDHLFAIGDNRDNSHDSRAWGFVPMHYLKGKAMFIWFSSKDFAPRFERIGTLIH
jgi:signal peptidase I